MSWLNSDVDIALPTVPLTTNRELHDELIPLYKAVQILQMELSKARKRISDLEAYNTAHP